jgi:hypothetical protein
MSYFLIPLNNVLFNFTSGSYGQINWTKAKETQGMVHVISGKGVNFKNWILLFWETANVCPESKGNVHNQ